MLAMIAALLVGVANPAVTQGTIADTICRHGWTKTIRPPASYTNRLKARQLAAAGLMSADPHAFEEDHVIALEVGGDPTDPANLRPQPWIGADGARAKDVVETRIHREICAGAITLDAGRAELMAWVADHKPYPALADDPAALADAAPPW